MQKLINILALLGFGMSATVTGGIGYVYMNQDSIKESIKQQVVDAATSGVKDALPGMMGGAVPPTTGLPVAPPTGGLFDKITKGYYTHDAMGCMMLLECEDGVKKIQSSADLIAEYPDADWGPVAGEFDLIMRAFNIIGVGVYLADEKYFPPGHRGVYHTVGNNFFLNKSFMHRPSVLMSVTRHEGWHAAQDCMAGSIENSLVAIIKNEEDVPMIWRTMAERTYLGAAVPWEAEAGWAGRTEGMTQKALESCARGTMWTDYEPTPKTREWLLENGYIKE